MSSGELVIEPAADGLPQTPGQLRQQHKREIRELKLKAKRAGKKLQHEFKQLQADMDARHSEEMEALTGAEAFDNGTDIASLSITQPDVHTKRSKAQRKRDKKIMHELAQEAQVAAEIASVGETKRQQEEKALNALLYANGLRVVDIPADGNCMYHALAQQCQINNLERVFQGQQMSPHMLLRRIAATYIEDHIEYFKPFMVDDETSGTQEEQIRSFIDGVNGHAWGSQVELQALATALGVQIQVFSVSNPPVEMGTGDQSCKLQICYLEHAYTSGHHYNSVEPWQQDTPFQKP